MRVVRVDDAHVRARSPGMSCIKPIAPFEESARGLKPDSIFITATRSGQGQRVLRSDASRTKREARGRRRRRCHRCSSAEVPDRIGASADGGGGHARRRRTRRPRCGRGPRDRRSERARRAATVLTESRHGRRGRRGPVRIARCTSSCVPSEGTSSLHRPIPVSTSEEVLQVVARFDEEPRAPAVVSSVPPPTRPAMRAERVVGLDEERRRASRRVLGGLRLARARVCARGARAPRRSRRAAQVPRRSEAAGPRAPAGCAHAPSCGGTAVDDREVGRPSSRHPRFFGRIAHAAAAHSRTR